MLIFFVERLCMDILRRLGRRQSRRQALRSLGMLAGAGLALDAGALAVNSALAKGAQADANPINHVLIACQENHTFDQYFGYYPRAGKFGVPANYSQPDGNGGYVTLETPTADEQQIVNKYDAPPYTNQTGSIPFTDIGNQYLMIGPGFSPQVFEGKNWQQIASALSDSSSPIAQGVIGTANYLTAAICMTTNQKPASVCQAAPIPAIEQTLNTTSFNTGSPQLATTGIASVAYIKRQD